MTSIKLNGFTRNYLSTIFRYDRASGKLFWRFQKNSRALAGQEVCSPDGKGYLKVTVDGQRMFVHRVIYFLLRGCVPKEIDHKDNNRTNNRLRNLRAATRKQNSGNSSMQRNNTSGLRGVSRHTRDREFWVAQIKIDKRQTYLGRFLSKKDAALAYNKAAKKHFGRFAKQNHV